MPIVSGSGGSVYLQGISTYTGTPTDDPVLASGFDTDNNVEFPISKWTLDKDSRLQEATRSFHVSGTRYKKTTKDPSWTLDLPLNTTATAESSGVGIVEGLQIPLMLFKVGSSSHYYMLLMSTVSNVTPICDAVGDIVRYHITGKGGDVTGPDTLANLGMFID